MMYVPPKEFQKHVGVSIFTLRRWADAGIVDSIRTPSNRRLFKLPTTGSEKTQDSENRGECIVYVRVSSPKQKDDLERQRAFMSAQFPNHRIVSDIGSGINWKRKGLLSILEQSMSGGVREVVVASRDRLCRFSFELLEWIFQKTGTRLTVLESKDRSPEDELGDDLLSIVQVFCCRRNGKRRYGHSHCREENQVEIDKGPEEEAEHMC
jgi:predicted site-specific integrase-resolvase